MVTLDPGPRLYAPHQRRGLAHMLCAQLHAKTSLRLGRGQSLQPCRSHGLSQRSRHLTRAYVGIHRGSRCLQRATTLEPARQCKGDWTTGPSSRPPSLYSFGPTLLAPPHFPLECPRPCSPVAQLSRLPPRISFSPVSPAILAQASLAQVLGKGEPLLTTEGPSPTSSSPT